MLRIAIVDDDCTIVEGIRHYLLKKVPDIIIDHCYTDGDEAFKTCKTSALIYLSQILRWGKFLDSN